MSGWEQVRFGDIFSLEKGQLQSSKCTPGEYTFITAANDWKTHNQYTHDCEAIIFAVAASGSLGRAHYFKGKFIASDLCFVLSEKDPQKHPVAFMFYKYVLNFLRREIVSATKAGTSKESISQKRLSEYHIPYIDIEHQKKWIDRLAGLDHINSEFSEAQNDQSDLLSLLRQSILQKAIEGKLTVAWRAMHPYRKGDPERDGAALLEKIKVEIRRLVADRALREEKAQDALVEKTIVVPSTWSLPLFGGITKQITDGTHQTPTYVERGEVFLSAQNVKPFRFIPEKHQFITRAAFLENRRNRCPELGDLLISRVGAGIGETAVIDQPIEFAFYVSLGLVKTFQEYTNSQYLSIVCNSPYGVAYAKGNISSGGTSAGNYNLGRIRSLPIPLPPLAEQDAIVERVESLLATVGELEKEVASRKVLAAELMREVLRGAFEG
jgi:type I restriction enzyme, S subunit